MKPARAAAAAEEERTHGDRGTAAEKLRQNLCITESRFECGCVLVFVFGWVTFKIVRPTQLYSPLLRPLLKGSKNMCVLLLDDIIRRFSVKY